MLCPPLVCRWRQTDGGDGRRCLPEATEVVEVTEVSEVTVVDALATVAAVVCVGGCRLTDAMCRGEWSEPKGLTGVGGAGGGEGLATAAAAAADVGVGRLTERIDSRVAVDAVDAVDKGDGVVGGADALSTAICVGGGRLMEVTDGVV